MEASHTRIDPDPVELSVIDPEPLAVRVRTSPKHVSTGAFQARLPDSPAAGS